MLGPGTIHWVKSAWNTVNSAWNFGDKQFDDFKAALERYAINEEIKYQNLVPMYSLIIAYLNSELSTQDDYKLLEYLYSNLKLKLDKEHSKQLRIKSFNKNVTKDNVNVIIFCDSLTCKREILNNFAVCRSCQ